MLFRLLDTLRKKPKHVREQYAFGGAVVFTAMVVGVWSLSLPARFAAISDGVSEVQPAAAPFAHMFSQLKEQVQRITSNDSDSSSEINDAPSTEPVGLPELTATTTLYDIPTTTTETLPSRPILIGTSSASTSLE